MRALLGCVGSCLFVLLVASPAPPGADRVVVGSKNFEESRAPRRDLRPAPGEPNRPRSRAPARARRDAGLLRGPEDRRDRRLPRVHRHRARLDPGRDREGGTGSDAQPGPLRVPPALGPLVARPSRIRELLGDRRPQGAGRARAADDDLRPRPHLEAPPRRLRPRVRGTRGRSPRSASGSMAWTSPRSSPSSRPSSTRRPGRRRSTRWTSTRRMPG